MSRIGKLPIPVPSGVTVKEADGVVAVKGPKGELSKKLPRTITLEIGDGELKLVRPDDKKESRALHGLARALTANLVIGVTEGFKKELEIHGVGYRAEAKGPSALRLNLGFSHPVDVSAPEGITFDVPQQTQIIVNGIDKEIVGQVAANIRSIRKPEPYKGKGIRYRGEQIQRKAGKSFVGSD